MLKIKINGKSLKIPTEFNEITWQDFITLKDKTVRERLEHLLKQNLPEDFTIPDYLYYPISRLSSEVLLPKSERYKNNIETVGKA